jgi:conjugative transfer ATPase
LRESDVKRAYERPPAFTDFLPWMEYLPEHQCFLLEDGQSVGALWELTPISVEARTPAFVNNVQEAVQGVLCDVVPEYDRDPWILQLYLQDEPSLTEFRDQHAAYVQPCTQSSAYTTHFLDHFAAHLAHVSRDGGFFEDNLVSHTNWGGKRRRVRLVLFRRGGWGRPADLKAEDELNDLAAMLETTLTSVGIGVRRATGRDFYAWMVRWFNPKPEMADSDPDRLLALAPYPGDDPATRPFGDDFAERLTFSRPESDLTAGTWSFDELPHAVITVQGLRRTPAIGAVSAERRIRDATVALFDQMPDYTVMVLMIVFKPQDTIRNHIARIKTASVGDQAEAILAREEAEAAERALGQGNKLYPVNLAVYVRGDDLNALRRHQNQVRSLLASNHLMPIQREADLLALDSYLRNLPMAFDVRHDKLARRSRLLYATDTASLAPLYGRALGTGHPGLSFWNRGGEPLVFDPLNRHDRKKNAHMLILGPTGAGKSALLVYLMEQMMAIYRPRLFIIEAGNSFGLLGQHLARHDVSVHSIVLNPNGRVSLPPFSEAHRLLHDPTARAISESDVPADVIEADDDAADEGRDLLGEMELAARIMITGGEAKEDARMSRQDRLTIRQAIYRAAEIARDAGRHQTLTQDVVAGLRDLAKAADLPEYRRHRAGEMADGLALFCHGMAGRFFNREGKPWPSVDVTILEMGILAREGYADQLTVAFLSIMNHINSLAEASQNDGRPTIVVTDEGHIITTNPLLAPYVVKITKMWRKLQTWLWIATQNLDDFPDAAKRMLNMMEWWLCLVMPKEEVQQIARFKDLAVEQEAMLLSAAKEPGKYTEGVVLGGNREMLFRNVPPALSLALAMTEGHEKAERHRIMRERGCSELEAAYAIAETIEARR